MSCCFYASCFCFATYTTGKSCYAVYCTGRFGCSLSVIPSMVAGFFYGLTICQSLSTISTICISCITGFTTGSSFFITNFGMKMFCCFCNVFCFCLTTNATSIGLYAFLCTCRIFSDYSLIPVMIFCFCNSIA